MENINVEGAAEKPVAQPVVDNGEDLLLAQIDAFREKATQLQQLIAQKERKAAELEALVREKEAINVKLQEELSRKQQ